MRRRRSGAGGSRSSSWPSTLPRGGADVVDAGSDVVVVGAADEPRCRQRAGEWHIRRRAPTERRTPGSVRRRPRGRIVRVTELLYLRDAYLTTFTGTVTDVRDGAVALDRTAFYPTGGGQPHDTGTLAASR